MIVENIGMQCETLQMLESYRRKYYDLKAEVRNMKESVCRSCRNIEHNQTQNTVRYKECQSVPVVGMSEESKVDITEAIHMLDK